MKSRSQQPIGLRKTFWVLLMLTLLLLGMVVAGLSLGSTLIRPDVVLRHLFGVGSGEYTFIIETLRVPRTMLAVLAGAALGVSGLILQSIIRNPLASPDIIGVTDGAAFAAVFFITFLSGAVGVQWLPLAAITGAGGVSLLIYLLSWKKGVSPIRLVLVGIGMAAAMSAFTTMMIVMSPIYSASKAYLWTTGSVYGANGANVYAMLPWIVFLLPLTAAFARSANVQYLGDQVAKGLGVKVQMLRFGLLFISVALAGSAVAFAGGIGFVGLIAPHISRKMIGPSFGRLIPASAVVGALIVVVSDLIARTAFMPLDLPAGVFVSGIGAPFFIYLLYRNRHYGL